MFELRPLTREDLPLLHRWFNLPHARRWFGHSMQHVEDVYGASLRGEETFDSFIASIDGAAIGLVNFGFFGDYPDLQHAYGVTDPDAANCDVLLAERAHEGLGPVLIREFLERIVFAHPRTTSVVIDPVPDNTIAIRAYEKVGFRFVRARKDDGEGNALYLLELSRDAFTRGRAPEPLTIRPARVSEIELLVDIDDDACTLYRDVGLAFDLPKDHPFAREERSRWLASIERGLVLVACDRASPVGFVAMARVDGVPYVEQLSVRRAHGRRGIGRALLLRALRWSVAEGELWLVTYDHVAWNAPFYERMGFERVRDSDVPSGIARLLHAARDVLPAPDHRIAMACRGPRHEAWSTSPDM